MVAAYDLLDKALDKLPRHDETDRTWAMLMQVVRKHDNLEDAYRAAGGLSLSAIAACYSSIKVVPLSVLTANLKTFYAMPPEVVPIDVKPASGERSLSDQLSQMFADTKTEVEMVYHLTSILMVYAGRSQAKNFTTMRHDLRNCYQRCLPEMRARLAN